MQKFCLMNFEGFFLKGIIWDICFQVITEILYFLCVLRFTCRLSSPPYSFLKVKINDLGLTPFMHDVTLDDFLWRHPYLYNCIKFRLEDPDKDSFQKHERRNTLPFKHKLLAIFKAEMYFHSLKIIIALSWRP